MNTPNSQRKPGKRRIMVQIWGRLADAIQREFNRLHIKRDAYLNALFEREIEALDREVQFKNSEEVRTRLREVKLPDRKKQTIELDDAVIERMEVVLHTKNIPRDSFINRVLFFLVATRPMIERLDIGYSDSEDGFFKPVDDARHALHDPFRRYREANDGRFYTIACFHEASFGPRGPNLFPLNTAISEEDWAMFNAAALDFELIFEDAVEPAHA
ncbi:MAG: hypothetical protein C4K60_20210 [Ideonella sp. MAG2]|nr:MAG: hypothetical protein C4K60_20210 [Ideonella sp. MAG2]